MFLKKKIKIDTTANKTEEEGGDGGDKTVEGDFY